MTGPEFGTVQPPGELDAPKHKNATMSQNMQFPVIVRKNKNGQSKRESNKRHFGDAGKQSFCCVLAIWALRSESAPCVLRSQHSEHSPGCGLVLRPAFCVLASLGGGGGCTPPGHRKRDDGAGLHRAEPSGADSVQLFVSCSTCFWRSRNRSNKKNKRLNKIARPGCKKVEQNLVQGFWSRAQRFCSTFCSTLNK